MIYAEAAALADKLGATVAYKKGDIELKMTKGSKTLTLPVILSEDQPMVSLRTVLEGFEYGLVWNPLSRSISIE